MQSLVIEYKSIKSKITINVLTTREAKKEMEEDELAVCILEDAFSFFLIRLLRLMPAKKINDVTITIKDISIVISEGPDRDIGHFPKEIKCMAELISEGKFDGDSTLCISCPCPKCTPQC